MGSFWRDTPKKMAKNAARRAPYWGVFLLFSAVPLYICEHLDRKNVLARRS